LIIEKLSYSTVLLLSLSFSDNAINSLFAKSGKIEYPWYKRLWRIFWFLRRIQRKKKQEQRAKKNQEQENKRREKKFIRRKQWRKIKVIVKSIFKFTKHNTALSKSKLEQERIKAWKNRRRHRIAKVWIKSLFRPSKTNKRKEAFFNKIQKEQEFAVYRRKRIYRFLWYKYSKIFRNFISGKGLPKRKKSNAPSVLKSAWSPNQLIITTNSLMFFLLSYFFIEFISNLSMATSAILFDYQTIVYYYKVEYLVDYDAWYGDSIKTIFAAGPVTALLIAILCIIIYGFVYLETGILKTFLLWTVFHGLNKIVGGTFVGNLIGKGFGYVIMYLYYSDTGKLVMSLLMLLLSIIIGTVSTKYWIMSGNSYYNFSKPHNRPVFIFSQVFLPFLLGNFIVWAVTQPESQAYTTMVNMYMILMVLPSMLINKYYQEFYYDEEPRKIKLSINTIFITIIIILTYRILLDSGLRIGSE
jgi:hypothetical protein